MICDVISGTAISPDWMFDSAISTGWGRPKSRLLANLRRDCCRAQMREALLCFSTPFECFTPPFTSSFLSVVSVLVNLLGVSLHRSYPHSFPSFQFLCVVWVFHSATPVRHFHRIIPLHPARSSPFFENCQLWGLNPTPRAINPKSLRAIRCAPVISKHGM